MNEIKVTKEQMQAIDDAIVHYGATVWNTCVTMLTGEQSGDNIGKATDDLRKLFDAPEKKYKLRWSDGTLSDVMPEERACFIRAFSLNNIPELIEVKEQDAINGSTP